MEGTHIHRYFPAASKLCLMSNSPAKPRPFKPRSPKSCRFLGKPSTGVGGGNRTTAQADRRQKYVWRCFTSLGSAFIFCFSLCSRLHLNKGVWDSQRPNFSLLFRASLKHVLTLSPRHPRQDWAPAARSCNLLINRPCTGFSSAISCLYSNRASWGTSPLTPFAFQSLFQSLFLEKPNLMHSLIL